LVRGIIDVAVKGPERLGFEGAPTLGRGLSQDAEARRAVATDGSALDTRKVVPDLTIAETARVAALVERAQAAVAPAAAAIRDAWVTDNATKIAAATGKPYHAVCAQLARAFGGVCGPEFPLAFDDFGTVSVRAVLADPDRYVNQTLADPNEPETQGRNCAILYKGRKDGALFISSLAHGGLTYYLAHDAESLSKAIDRASPESVYGVLKEGYPYALLDEEAELQVLAAAQAKAGYDASGKRAGWAKLVRALTTARRAAQPKPEPKPVATALPEFLVPDSDAPYLPVLGPLDEVLCNGPGPEPPFRSLAGRYATIQYCSPAIMHRLVSSEQVAEEDRLPAPPILSIVEIDATTLQMETEKYLTYYKETVGKDKHGPPIKVRVPVQFPWNFARAYSTWGGSKLPRVEAVLTLPMVLNGGLISGVGLDRKLNAIFKVDPRLMEALPKGPVPRAKARNSYEWLREEFFKDVPFKDPLKDVPKALAIPLTIIQRCLLDKRPMFMCTGDVAGVGKTTLVNMLVGPVTGHAAPAMAWSEDPEERKKAIFAVGIAGVPCIVFDNIERGAVINCPHINRMVTGVEISDRVLGESRYATVQAKTIVVYNGNAIGTKGDAAGRTLHFYLESLGRHPAERKFAREQPENWAIDYRLQVLTHLYNVLMVEREPVERAKTRFKQWWQLVAHPLEIVSGVNFSEELASDDDENDEQAAAKTRIVKRLAARFPDQTDLAGTVKATTFSAGNVRALLPHESMLDVEREAAEDLAADMKTVAGRDFSTNADGVGRVLTKYVTGWVDLGGGREGRLETVKITGKQGAYRVKVKT
jgi:hypothetical protein